MSALCGKYSLHLESTSPDADGNHTDIITSARCKSWDCPICRPIKGRWLQDQIHRIFADTDLHMLTLTYFQSRPPLDVWQNLGKTWNRLLTFIRKQNPGIKFIRIIEPHKSGYPHLHVLFSQYINVSKCLKYLTKQGFGWNCNLKKISIDSARNYVAKYLTKQVWSDLANDLRKQSKSRIVSASHGIVLTPESTGQFTMVEPKINDTSLNKYVSRVVNNRCASNFFPVTFYIGYRFIRIVWHVVNDPDSILYSKQIVSQHITRIDEYF